MENEIFDKLYQKTSEHLRHKRYLYKPKVTETYRFNDRNGNKKGDKKTDINGNIQYKKNITPTAHKSVILSLAFNMAYENYRNLRAPFTGVKEIKDTSNISDMLIRYFSNKYYKNIDDIKVENNLINSNQNYEYEEIERFKKIEFKLYGTIERLRNYHSHYIHEPGILTFEDLFKQGKTLSSDDFKEAKEWFYKRFNETHSHLTQSLKNRKKKLEEENTKESKEKIEQINKVLKAFEYIQFLDDDTQNLSLNGQLFIACMFLYKRQAKVVLDKWRGVKDPEGYENTKQTFFTYYCLSERYSINNYNDNLLKFRDITSKLSTIPYSTNSNLAFIYEKINKINAENYEAINSFEEKKQPHHNKNKPTNRKPKPNTKLKNQLETKKIERDNLIDLLKIKNKNIFRKKLENVENEITELESKIYQAKPNTINTPKTQPTLEELQSKIMPFRKRHILTGVLLQYLLDNGLITDKYKIAVKKTPTDVIEYYKKHENELDKTKNLTFLKNQIKALEKGSEERIKLNKHLKELKRNFVFKTPTELQELNKPVTTEDGIFPAKGYNFTLKKKNTLIQYTAKNGITANVTLSAQLLIKWVFIHLTSNSSNKKDGNKGFQIITTFVEDYIEGLSKQGNTSEKLKTEFFINPNYQHLKGKGKVFPKSINHNTNQIEDIATETITDNLKFRIETLEKFKKTNEAQNKPWKFDAKGKIDTILKFMHFCLVHDVYKNKDDKATNQSAEDFIRHNYFNMTTYNIAREYFRYFGRYKNQSFIKEIQEYALPVIEKLKKEHKACFKYINNEIRKSNSLEELFKAVITSYIKKLKEIEDNFNEYTIFQLATILKITQKSNTANVNAILSTHYARSFAISPDIISIKKESAVLWETFKKEKEKTLNGKPFYCSEYAFVRNHLQSLDAVTTNIDFLYKHIIDYNEVGKLENINRTTLSKELLQLKTEELILWNIAKTYWLKANGEAYNFTDEEKNTKNANYQEFCTFNKVYNKELNYTITIDDKFWIHKNGMPDNKVRFNTIYKLELDNISFNIKVPARKYDNKFLSVETKLIKEFCLWNCFNTDTNKVELNKAYKYTNKNNVTSIHNLTEYEGLMSVIYKQLKTSVSDIGLVLSTEKKIVDKNITKYLTILEDKYKNNNSIADFYLTFSNTAKNFEDEDALFKDFISKINDAFLDNKKTIEEYLVSFRNFALHYQLQNPDNKKIIVKFLETINNYKFAERGKYYTDEK
jgi:hypothetical protein